MGLDGAAGGAADDLTQLLKGAISILITGHSLGAALGHLLSFDLAAPKRLGSRVQSVQFASPRPGDAAFGQALLARIPGHRSYWWHRDAVPQVPPTELGYASVPGSIELTLPPSIEVAPGLAAAHHVLTYATLLDYTSLASFPAIAIDLPFLGCIRVRQL